MTCIVGIQYKGQVFIGGDSAGISGYDSCIRADEKVFHNDAFLMGFTDSFRMGQLLRYSFKPPKQKVRDTDMHFLVTDFTDSMRKVFSNKGFLRKVNERESGGTFLMGYRGKLYEINEDFQVGIPDDGVAAVGCGSGYALGALYATQGLSDQLERVDMALKAATHYSAGVRPPYVVLSSDKYKVRP